MSQPSFVSHDDFFPSGVFLEHGPVSPGSPKQLGREVTTDLSPVVDQLASKGGSVAQPLIKANPAGQAAERSLGDRAPSVKQMDVTEVVYQGSPQQVPYRNNL